MPTQADYRHHLQGFQSARLRRDYADFVADPRYSALADFFFDQLYGTHDLATLRAETQRLGQFIHMLPAISLQDIERVFELLDLTAQLDDDLVSRLHHAAAPIPIDQSSYERAYREANSYDARLRQIDLLRATLQKVHRIAHQPQVGTVLMQTQALAPMLGVRTVHAFLLKGYNVFRSIGDVTPFSNAVSTRERALLDHIYGRSKA